MQDLSFSFSKERAIAQLQCWVPRKQMGDYGCRIMIHVINCQRVKSGLIVSNLFLFVDSMFWSLEAIYAYNIAFNN